MGKSGWALAAALAVLAGGALVSIRGGGVNAAAAFSAGEKPLTNPLKGFVAWGENYRDDPWVTLAYVPVYWRELEPEPGVYDFAALEERCHFDRWEQSGVRLILRVVADEPGQAAHMDIPQWLYDAMEGDGDWYDGDYGKGFSPNYENEVFRRAHRELVAALAERYAQDPRLAFVQLGSLGHWGEWHVDTGAGIRSFPTQSVTDGYVRDYLACFDAGRLLLRRPYAIGAKEGMGLYNDAFASPETHEQWLGWIETGYTSDQNGEDLDGMPGFWRQAPSGGELASYAEPAWYFSSRQFAVTLDLVRRSHTSFLGPKAPKREDLGDTERQNAERLLQELGYSLGVRLCRVAGDLTDGLRVQLVWQNTGVAPLYADWPLQFELRDAQGITRWQGRASGCFSQWGPGEHAHTLTIAAGADLDPGRYTLYMGIVDPLTDAPGVALQMQTEHDGALYRLVDLDL